MTTTMVSNGPVPDTKENRAKYGQPMSRAGLEGAGVEHMKPASICAVTGQPIGVDEGGLPVWPEEQWNVGVHEGNAVRSGVDLSGAKCITPLRCVTRHYPMPALLRNTGSRLDRRCIDASLRPLFPAVL